MQAPGDTTTNPGYREGSPRARSIRRGTLTSLPEIPDASPSDHIWFEWTAGHFTAIDLLRKHLGAIGAARALVGLARRQVVSDPFSDLPKAETTAEWLSRRQLGPVLLLEEALRDDLELDHERIMQVLSDLISQSGARLLSRRFPSLSPPAWAAASPDARERLARRVFARLGNITEASIRTSEDGLELDVTACRFVQLLQTLGRTHLAPLFCKADQVFFDRPGAPVSLQRTTTLAAGHSRCDFRFRLDSP